METDPKPTQAELGANLALIQYLGIALYVETLSYLCSKAD